MHWRAVCPPGLQRGDARLHGLVPGWGSRAVGDGSTTTDLFIEPSEQRITLARSAPLHELAHFCQAQRDGPIHPRSERAWLQREDEAYTVTNHLSARARLSHRAGVAQDSGRMRR